VALDLHVELRRIVETFDRGGMAYALAGGLAVAIHATPPRATMDIDVLLAPEHLEAAVAALEALGYRRAGAAMRVAGGRLSIQRLIRIDGSDVLPVDLLLPPDPELGRVLSEHRRLTWEGQSLSVVSAAGLRTLKRLHGSAARAVTTPHDAATALRQASALRALCRRLPRLPTAAAEARWGRFEALLPAPESACQADVDALREGWGRWWREEHTGALAAMAARVPGDLIATDRELATYATAAQLARAREAS
jgi:hypothetical protein